MSEVPANLRYSKSHEWLRQESDGTVVLGVTDHAQAALGDLVFVELPDVGSELSAAQECAVVESVKAASDIYAPIAATVVAVNDALNTTPELVNQSPYEAGWLMQLKPNDKSDIEQLLDATAYQAEVAD